MYKVIIVEDEDIIRKGLVYSVPWAEMDCSVVGEAANGIEGLELIREHNPDIAVIDINMPIMDGFQMLENSYEQYNYAPIILSGYSDFEYAKRAIHYGVKGYLLNPGRLDFPSEDQRGLGEHLGAEGFPEAARGGPAGPPDAGIHL